MNREYSQEIVGKLMGWGVSEFIVCAGARDIPLIEAVSSIESKAKLVFSHFEERSAAFYALGRIKSLKTPVAVVTTSGTAVGELLPAVMESYYLGLPLVLITADRPACYRGTGAPQSADQKNIFGVYVSHCFDLQPGNPLSLAHILPNKPLHLNICFDVPLQSGELSCVTASDFQRSKTELLPCAFEIDLSFLSSFVQAHYGHLLVVVGQLPFSEEKAVLSFLERLSCPVYCEGLSHLREREELHSQRIYCADGIWKQAEEAGCLITGVIKIGGTPTHRFWRDLEEKHTDVQVLSLSHLPFSGMPRAVHHTLPSYACLSLFSMAPPMGNHTSEMAIFFHSRLKAEVSPSKRDGKGCEFLETANIPNRKPQDFSLMLKENFRLHTKIRELLYRFPRSEQSIFAALSENMNSEARVFVGNSLPIRYWDLAASFQFKALYVEASRGLNGIDGQISTALGFFEETSEENWGIFGDLTTLYDMAGFWICRQRPELHGNIVVINNGGGRIFGKVLQGEISYLCQNEHHLSMQPLAQLWGISYEKVENCFSFLAQREKKKGLVLLECVPCSEETQLFEREFQSLLHS
jgi:2-succinyl-5-enolpyruvyl-6-hydroxy-3-cyclohexene-1-carboxylate synthase